MSQGILEEKRKAILTAKKWIAEHVNVNLQVSTCDYKQMDERFVCRKERGHLGCCDVVKVDPPDVPGVVRRGDESVAEVTDHFRSASAGGGGMSHAMAQTVSQVVKNQYFPDKPSAGLGAGWFEVLKHGMPPADNWVANQLKPTPKEKAEASVQLIESLGDKDRLTDLEAQVYERALTCALKYYYE